MKRILSMLLLAVTISGATYTTAEAQAPTKVATFKTPTYRNAGDSINRNDSMLYNFDANSIGHAVHYKYDLLFKVKYTRLSGTMSATSKLKGAYDSVNGPWYTIRGNITQCPGCVDSTFTTGNTATDYATWLVPASPFPYYRLYNTTGATGTVNISMTTNYKY